MLQIFSNRHIDVLIEDVGDRKKWRFTGFYGSSYTHDRDESWNLLRRLRNHGEYPWLVLKRNVVYLERREGWKRFESLVDVGYSGNWFTWERGNLPETNIQERLDRGVATEEWSSLFPNSLIQHLPHSFSDHCPLLINITYRARRLVNKNFKFEAWWVLEETFLEEVRRIWENSTGDLVSNLENMKGGLESWASQIRRNRKMKIEVLTSKLTTLLESDKSDENLVELIDTKIHLNFEIEKDECYWEQRARINLLKLGDRNTTFFHKQATKRRKLNLIYKMQFEDGRETKEIKEMEEIARSYFMKLFSAGRQDNYDKILSGIDWFILEEDNNKLKARYTKEEILEALSEMGPTKAPVEDGFPAVFYQKCWPIIKVGVFTFCL
ncbi:reverse transcriptase [Gossypium australe]|uniref:Reverse transcriptase n=1 Tax=Gossypium australe TaxID=47621 RepID=A0A5B6WDU6_9ROSI|nr:reverse transcriptase [Gossypium australe]